MTDIIWAGIISIIFLLFFVVAEILRKKGIKPEATRKFVHFSGAFVTIFFPFILNSHWTVLVLAAGFAFIMLLTKKLELLQSVHGVMRKSDGAIYHPVAIYTCFLYSQILNQPMFYVIAILILAVSDALAALVGKSYGANEYLVEVGTRKTIEGSVTFFLTSFLIVHLILLLTTQTGRVESVLIALLISIIVTVFEGVSLKGADNLFIPLATMFILSKNITPTVNGISFQIFVLIGFLVGYLILMLPYKRIGFSGVLLLGLINYTIWALLGNIYAIILFGFSFICAKTDLILNYDCEESDAYRVRPVFYIMTVPVVCAFLGNFIGENIIFPFVVSIICESVIIKTRLFKGDLNKGLWLTSIVSLIMLGVSYVFIG
ncbi:phosphatidate cytidylyltransferase [bacterium]|nr:phosphatidate cytidylyltransferase [bacterium]